jgi:phasin family protein
MFTSPDLIASQQASVDALFGVTRRVFDGLGAVVELNLEFARDGLSEAAETTSGVFSVGDAQELLPLGLQPVLERVTGYSRRLYEIASKTQADVTELAGSAATKAQNQWLATIGSVGQSVPSGADSPLSFVQSAMTAANDAMATFQRAALQAVAVVEAPHEDADAAIKPARSVRKKQTA